MPRSSDFDGIETDFPDITDLPLSAEMHIVASGADYNITPTQLFGVFGIDPDDVLQGGADAASALDSYLGSSDWRAGAVGGGGVLLNEVDMISDSTTAAPTQHSVKSYVTTGLATKAATSHTQAASTISDSTTAGRALLTAADVTAQLAALGVQAGATDDQTAAEMKTALETLTTTARLSYTAVKDLDVAAAGVLYEDALIANGSLTVGQSIKVNSGATAFEAWTPGTAAVLAAYVPGAPAAASSSAGAITLNFVAGAVATTTTENITAITVSNLALYATEKWTVTNTTARNITFPSTWFVPVSANPTYTGTASSIVDIIIYRASSTVYHVSIGDVRTVVA